MFGFRIVETNSYDRDYPNEKFVGPLPAMTKEQAELVARTINDIANAQVPHPRYWKVVPKDYVLVPGFKP